MTFASLTGVRALTFALFMLAVVWGWRREHKRRQWRRLWEEVIPDRGP